MSASLITKNLSPVDPVNLTGHKTDKLTFPISSRGANWCSHEVAASSCSHTCKHRHMQAAAPKETLVTILTPCTFHHNLLHFQAISAPKVPSNSVLITTEFANPPWKKQNLFQLIFLHGWIVENTHIPCFLSSPHYHCWNCIPHDFTSL